MPVSSGTPLGAERRIRLSAEAEVDLRQATNWYEWQQPALGERFLQAVDEALENLSIAQAHGSPVPGVAAHLRARRLRLRDFPYFVIFRELEDEVQVAAFAHERRRPTYWQRRLKRGF